MKIKLILESKIESIEPSLSLVETLCKQKGFSQKENNDLRLALEEVLSNIVDYSFDPHDTDTDIAITINEISGGMEIRIHQNGIPFTLDAAPHYNPQKIKTVDDALQEKGLGLFLASKKVDKLECRYLGQKGNESLIVKYQSDPKVIGHKLSENKMLAEIQKLTEDDIKIVLFRPADALNVARCLYATYGYTYLKAALYNPEYLKEYAQSENTIIVTAVSEKITTPSDIHSEKSSFVAGVAIGSEDSAFAGIMEIGSLVVSWQLRGMHISDKLCIDLLDRIIQAGKNGVYTECVTLHTASQKVSLRLGLFPCCFYLNFIPNEVHFKNFDVQKSKRQTFVVYYKSIKSNNAQICFAENTGALSDDPQGTAQRKLQDKILRIYKRLHITPNIVFKKNCLSEKSNIDVSRNETFRICLMFAKSISSDFADSIKKIMATRSFSIVETWMLYLNLSDAAWFYAYSDLKKLGFVWSGILPGSANGDFLVMQYVENVVFEEINMACPEDDSWMLESVKEEYENRVY
ncbi:hypothetical protein FACS1894190_01030 [Spirochaetia bacterium]|nr:hypothetical protein FACS1894190_01030 [Spirochaetia bacterium]